ncbi:hypothetical protein PLICRDRAFT_43453 [Plicaturopsis crispa FD-325 SS-3]|nr:hypothetical protein PLICRDRAFT_43453 [Plicaturopsis crispa FD-325 SS-3]
MDSWSTVRSFSSRLSHHKFVQTIHANCNNGRHGLDADHIAAIDNATRNMISLGHLPITCGLFFSLGHSTIVIAFNIAIAVSVSIWSHFDGSPLSSVGGIVGTSVSASFLFLIALFNSIVLFRIARQRRRRSANATASGNVVEDEYPKELQGGGFMFLALSKLLRLVDASWKLYPIGVLFGLGFDTASSIALLALSALAPDIHIKSSSIVILPFLFTAGMSLVDSLDSILMIYAYARPPKSSLDGQWAFFQHSGRVSHPLVDSAAIVSDTRTARVDAPTIGSGLDLERAASALAADPAVTKEIAPADATASIIDPDIRRRRTEAKLQTMSSLSIWLTLMSICVAFSISLIEIMGLIGDNCSHCVEAASSEGSGLAGRWWRAWAKANDASGYIGAAVVGCFVVILGASYGLKWILDRRYRRTSSDSQVSS